MMVIADDLCDAITCALLMSLLQTILDVVSIWCFSCFTYIEKPIRFVWKIVCDHNDGKFFKKSFDFCLWNAFCPMYREFVWFNNQLWQPVYKNDKSSYCWVYYTTLILLSLSFKGQGILFYHRLNAVFVYPYPLSAIWIKRPTIFFFSFSSVALSLRML